MKTFMNYTYIMTEPIMTSRLMFNASLLYGKRLDSLTDLERLRTSNSSRSVRLSNLFPYSIDALKINRDGMIGSVIM